MPHKKIPVCLITGFLGSGKTTTLKNMAERYRSQKIVYLINEFCANDIDGGLVQEDDADVVMIPGGSIFCKCLVTQFIGNMKEIPQKYPDIDGLVIEASGMANPAVIEDMLKETGLDKTYALSTILAVIDPGSYMKLCHTLPNVVAQAQAADSILINKIDLYDEDTITKTESALRDTNPSADIIRTKNGAFLTDPFNVSESSRALSGEYAQCRDPNYSSETITFDGDIETLKKFIIDREKDLYRVKGHALCSNKLYYVDYSSSGLTITESSSKTDKPCLAVIYRGTQC